jgi:hypothetical protein
MINIRRFCLGKGKLKKCYKGICLTIYRLKFEIIWQGKKRQYRIEWSDWCEH